MNKKEKRKFIFFGVALFVWVMVYIALFVPAMNKYLINNPEFPAFVAFAINIGFVFSGLFIVSFIMDGLEFAFNFASSLTLNFVGFDLIQQPLCLTPNTGQLMTTANNFTCYFSSDNFFASLLNTIFNIPYNLTLYYFTYAGIGFILILIGSIKMYYALKKKFKK